MSPARPKVLVIAARGAHSFSDEQRRRLGAVAEVEFLNAEVKLLPEVFLGAVKDADYVALNPRGTPPLTPALLRRLPKLKGVAIPTTGFEWLNVALLQQRGIPVANVPDYSSTSTAEFAFALMLALARKLMLAQEEPWAGGRLRGMQLEGKTLGIVGLGAVGRAVARIAIQGFRMKALGSDPSGRAPAGVERVPLDELLARSEVVTLHLPLLPSTRGLIDAAALARMRSGALLINTARPQVVDQRAVARALRRGHLGGYAVDWGYEKKKVAAALEGAANALVMPHIAWYTPEAIQKGLDGWVDAIEALCRGRPKHLVPPLTGKRR